MQFQLTPAKTISSQLALAHTSACSCRALSAYYLQQLFGFSLLLHVPAIACESSPPPLFWSYYFGLFLCLIAVLNTCDQGGLHVCTWSRTSLDCWAMLFWSLLQLSQDISASAGKHLAKVLRRQVRNLTNVVVLWTSEALYFCEYFNAQICKPCLQQIHLQ